MQKINKSEKLCYLCGKPGADTKDHIPPRGIFPKELKGQLITVAAHKSCNEMYSADDELFRNVTIMASHRSPEGLKAWNEQVVSSWKKNKGARLALISRVLPAWMRDPLGRMTRREALTLEESVVRREVDRWTRGLFYHRFKEPFPSDIPVQVEKLQPPEISLKSLDKIMISNGVVPSWIHVEPGVFSYLFGPAHDDKHTMIALFVFFNTEVYMGATKV